MLMAWLSMCKCNTKLEHFSDVCFSFAHAERETFRMLLYSYDEGLNLAHKEADKCDDGMEEPLSMEPYKCRETDLAFK